MAMTRPKPPRKQAIAHPGERSRPTQAPAAAKPAVTATRNMTLPKTSRDVAAAASAVARSRVSRW